MSKTIRITIFEGHRQVHSDEYSEPVELGRQDRDDGELYRGHMKDGRWRIPIAAKDEVTVSKKQAMVEALADGRIRLTNQSTGVPLQVLEDQTELRPSSSRDLPSPVTLRIGARELSFETILFQTLAHSPLPPGGPPPDQSIFGTIASGRLSEQTDLFRWLEATMDVIHGTATAIDCFDRATSALVDLTGVEAGRVLMLEDKSDKWLVKSVARSAPSVDAQDSDWKPSRQALALVRKEKKTLWQLPPTRSGTLDSLDALLVAPILDQQGQVIGALYGDRKKADGPLRDGRITLGVVTELQAKLAQLLASGVAAALVQKKLTEIERDLKIGRQIQAGFLPDCLPQPAGWEVAAHFRPARNVSGDFYDVFALPGGLLALVIADVCDKGVGAALYMALVRSLLRAFAAQAASFGKTESAFTTTVGQAASDRRTGLMAKHVALAAVARTNNYVAQNHARDCMFATVFFGVLDTASGALAYVNAGHDAPILLGPATVKARLDRTGVAVGFEPNFTYEIGAACLEPGDTLFAYTDGVTEARDPAGSLFTEKRLLAILEKPVGSAAELVGNVKAGLEAHGAGADPYDDVTMLAVWRRRPFMHRTSLTVPATLDALSDISAFVLAAADAAGIHGQARYRLRLAVDEIATNIVTYGYPAGGVAPQTIDLQAETDDKTLKILLEDRGVAFDPRQAPPPADLHAPPEERQIGGLGVYLALGGVDQFFYERAEDRNRNILVVNRP